MSETGGECSKRLHVLLSEFHKVRDEYSWSNFQTDFFNAYILINYLPEKIKMNTIEKVVGYHLVLMSVKSPLA